MARKRRASTPTPHRQGEGVQAPQWAQLPAEVMQHVFRHLPHKDRFQARLVCRSWDRAFRTPQVWRGKTFHFPGAHTEEGERAARFLQTFGAHLRRLNLQIGAPLLRSARTMGLSVQTFLDTKPPGMKLRAFDCSGMGSFQTDVYRIALQRLRIVRSLCGFLRRQRCLERVDLAGSHMGKQDGVRVLKALAAHCRTRRGNKPATSRLQHLDLTDFFIGDMNVVESVPTLPAEMEKFSALKHVALTFTYLSDDLLAALTRKNSQSLTTLTLILADLTQLMLTSHMAHNNEAVTTGGWRAASSHCPQLKVHLKLKGSFRLTDFQRLLVPGMPLEALSITSPSSSTASDNMLQDIPSLMDDLTQHFSSTLNVFYLEWDDPMTVWTDQEAVVKLVDSCPSLQSLTLALTVPLHTVLQVATAAKHCLHCPPILTVRAPRTCFLCPVKSLTIDVQHDPPGSRPLEAPDAGPPPSGLKEPPLQWDNSKDDRSSCDLATSDSIPVSHHFAPLSELTLCEQITTGDNSGPAESSKQDRKFAKDFSCKRSKRSSSEMVM